MKKTALHYIAAQPWAIESEAFSTIVGIAQRLNDEPISIENKLEALLNSNNERYGNARYTVRRDNVGILNVIGPIFRYANVLTRFSGATSLEIISSELLALRDDDSISDIIINFDSPGGQATSISEIAKITNKITNKSVYAYVDGMAASAAYWWGSATDRIFVSETAQVGSIGVILTIYPDNESKSIQVVSSQSPYKKIDPKSDSDIERLQQHVDEVAEIFIQNIAKYRNVTVETVKADFGQGGVVLGAKAVKLGMADEVTIMDDLISGLISNNNKIRGGLFAMDKIKDKMSKNATVLTVEKVKTDHPEIAEALIAEGRLSASKAEEDVAREAYGLGQDVGEANERERIEAVYNQGKMLPGHAKMVENLMFDGKTTGPEAAVKILAAENKKVSAAGEDFMSDAPDTVTDVDAGEKPAGAKNKQALPVEEAAKLEWDEDAKLQKEFGSFEKYYAYRKAESQEG